MPLFFAIKDFHWSHSHTYTRLIVETFEPVHLSAFITIIHPVSILKWGEIRGLPLRCIPSWHLRQGQIIAQNEAGDTTMHTIDYPVGTSLDFQWWVMKGTISGVDTVSVSPILKHLPTEPSASLWYAKLLDPDIMGTMLGVPHSAPHLNLNVVGPLNGETGSWIRGIQTIGPFPNPPGGALFNIEYPLDWIKYSLIQMVRTKALVKKDHWSGIWSCSGGSKPSYLPQLRINGAMWYGQPVTIETGWGTYWTYYELWSGNPLSGLDWNKTGFEDIAIGLQMQQPCIHGFRIQTYCAYLILEIYYWT